VEVVDEVVVFTVVDVVTEELVFVELGTLAELEGTPVEPQPTRLDEIAISSYQKVLLSPP
jgi:hypothetical protein